MSTAFGAASPPVAKPAGPLLDVRTSHDSIFMDVPDGLVSNITLLARVGDPTLGRDDISLVLDDQRRPTHVCIVMDTSGSMAERGRLTYAKRATREVLAILRPTDTVSIVTFNTRARAAVEPIYATKEAKANIRMVLETFIPDGNTDFDAALAEVASCFREASDRDAVNYAVFISDGAPTQGTRDPRTLGRLASGLTRLGVSVDTIGVGEEIRLETLQAIAQAGNGRFHAVADDAALVDLVAGRVLSATGYLGENGVLVFRPAPGVDVVHAGDGWAARADGTLVATLGLLHRGESEARLLDLAPRSGGGDGLTLTLGRMTLDYIDRREQPRSESITVTLDVTDDSQAHERSADPVVLYAANRIRLGDSFRRAYDLAADGRTSEAAEVLDRAVSSVDVLLTGTGSMSAELEPLADLVERARSYGNMLARGRFTGELRDALYRDATEP